MATDGRVQEILLSLYRSNALHAEAMVLKHFIQYSEVPKHSKGSNPRLVETVESKKDALPQDNWTDWQRLRSDLGWYCKY